MRPHRRIVVDVIKNHFGEECHLAGVEIGVQHGMLARRLLESFKNLTLFMVDPWEAAKKGSSWADTRDSSARSSPAKHWDNRRLAYERTEECRRRRIVMEMPSLDASFLAPSGLDFVIIDGDHSEPSVQTDVNSWFPKLKIDGLFMGHDFSPEKVGPPWNFGVVPVVDAFCKKNNLKLHLEEHSVWWTLAHPEE